MTEAILSIQQADGKWKPRRIPPANLTEESSALPIELFHLASPHVIVVYDKNEHGQPTHEITRLGVTGRDEYFYTLEGVTYKVSHASGTGFGVRKY